MSYFINLFGTGIRYWTCNVPKDLFNQMDQERLKTNIDWETLIYDQGFLKMFGYKNFQDLSKAKEKIGFILNKGNKIEIKQRAKYLLKTSSRELYGDESLFPKFQTEIINLDFVPKDDMILMIIIQTEVGLIGKFTIENELFNIDQLTFRLTKLLPEDSDLVLFELNYDSKKLRSIKDDSVIRNTKVVIIDSNE